MSDHKGTPGEEVRARAGFTAEDETEITAVRDSMLAVPEVRTVGDLIAVLSRHDPGALLVTDGYEGAFTTLSAAVATEVQQLDRDPDQAAYLGEYETVDEARRQAALSPDDPEVAIVGIAPPRLVGTPRARCRAAPTDEELGDD